MSTISPTDGTKRPPFESSRFATRAFNTLRYSVMNLFILFGVVFIALGGPWSYIGLIFSFVLVGYVDELFGDVTDQERMPPIWYCQLMLFATLPLLIFATLIASMSAMPPVGPGSISSPAPSASIRIRRAPTRISGSGRPAPMSASECITARQA